MGLLIFALLTMFIYLIYVRVRYGMTKSISATYYEIEHKALFTFVLWAFSVPMIIIGGGKVLIFLAGAAICFVGAAPGVKHYLSRRVHIIGSYTGISLGVIGMWVYYGFWWIPVIQLLFTVPAMNLKMRNHTYWIEFLAVILTAVGLFFGEIV